MDLQFVTSNQSKIKEAENILKLKVNKVDIDIKEIQAIEVEEIVKDKANRAYNIVRKPVLVEDTGLYIESWNGFPGALIKWVLKTIGNQGLCKILKEYDRKTTAKTCVCIYNGKDFHVFTGEINGETTKEPRGKSGFGWDSVFQPDGLNKTFAEMSQEEKDKISMRKIALLKMKEFLEENPSFISGS